MIVWITGTSGLAGSYAYKRLCCESDYEVVSINREIISDLSDSSELCSIEKLEKPDCIVHCAATIPGQRHSDRQAAEINRKIDDNILQIANVFGAKVIYASSFSVYKEYGKEVILEESMPTHVSAGECSMYVWEKIQSERLFETLNDCIIFRISSPYGLGQKNTNVLKVFVDNVRENKNISYFGTGERTQDFIHSSDIAEAIAAALLAGVSGIYNIGFGRSVSMKQLAQCVAACAPRYTGAVSGSDEDDPQRDFRVNLCNEKARMSFGWTPKISLERGIKELLEA